MYYLNKEIDLKVQVKHLSSSGEINVYYWSIYKSLKSNRGWKVILEKKSQKYATYQKEILQYNFTF